jgi:hypothetical protein
VGHSIPDLFRGVFIHRARQVIGDEDEVRRLVGNDLGAADDLETSLQG